MKINKHIIASVIALTIVGGIAFAYQKNKTPQIPQTFEELIQLSDEEIENFDIARMNLLCAKGLPGSEDLDIEQCLLKLDQWAQHVKLREQQSLPVFFKYKEKYKNSMALFKGAYLGFAIQDDFKCDYNMELYESGAMEDRTSTRFFHDSSNIFINGLINDLKGTCSSMPVLMVVLGRRCEYPLHLVKCSGHMFVRWDDGIERFNFDITNNKGVKTENDEYYLNFPRPISKKEIAEECMMKNSTNKEMLGIFASLRAICFQEHQRYDEALFCEEIAQQIFPNSQITSLRITRLKILKSEGNEL
ncbi:MAG: hypothetical protein ISR85_01370 [Kiritimatiellales bacterium]|nr:hypothetical protein [Kiritimatiellota bacterium]MBL7011563.1 hypothetical protein [Kiritimatiellales bacterium]